MQGKRTNDGTLKDTVPVAGHPYKIISPSLFNTRFVPESGRVPPLVRLPYHRWATMLLLIHFSFAQNVQESGRLSKSVLRTRSASRLSSCARIQKDPNCRMLLQPKWLKSQRSWMKRGWSGTNSRKTLMIFLDAAKRERRPVNTTKWLCSGSGVIPICAKIYNCDLLKMFGPDNKNLVLQEYNDDDLKHRRHLYRAWKEENDIVTMDWPSQSLSGRLGHYKEPACRKVCSQFGAAFEGSSKDLA